MDSESDYFSEVEEISDVSKDLLHLIPERTYDLERCLQFVQKHQTIRGIRDVFLFFQHRLV